MALQVWLPLRGDVQNQGIANVTFTAGANSLWNQTGRLGLCYEWPNLINSFLKANSTTWMNEFTNNTFSLCMWVRRAIPDDTNNTYENYFYAGTGGTSWVNYSVSLMCMKDAHDIRIYLSNGTGTAALASGFIPPADEWHHYTVTYDGSTLSLYIDGILNKSVATTLIINWSQVAHINIGGAASGNSERALGCTQDVRFYDHCLSAKEVKSISQALAIHYTLDTWCPQGYRRLLYIESEHNEVLDLEVTQAADIHYEGCFMAAANMSNYLFGSKQMGSMGYNGFYRLTGMEINYSGTGQIFSTNPNELITFKQVLDGNNLITYCNGKSSTRTFGNLNANDNGTIAFFGIPQASAAGCRPFGTQVKLYWLKIKNASGIIRDLIPVERIEDSAVGVYDLINNIFLNTNLNTSIDTTFTAGPVAADSQSNIIYDCSGYSLNGTSNGALSMSAVSPRYTSCMYFPAVLGETYIKVPFATINKDRNYTLNVWFNKDKQSSCPWDTIFGAGSGYELEMRTTSAAGGLNKIYLYSWGSTAMGETEYTLNEWHMLTFASDLTTIYVYLDGELLGTRPSKDPVGGQYYLAAWSGRQNYQGYLSDMRIYTTCLSAVDVKELYETSMNIDSNGNISARILTT